MKLKFKISKADFLRVAPLSFKYFYLSLAIIFAGALAFLGWFIYQYFYQTVTQAEEVIVLKKEVAPDSINLPRITAVLAAIDAKNNAPIIDWVKIKNPFTITVPIESAPNTPAATEPASTTVKP